jgi:hypothetical protein
MGGLGSNILSSAHRDCSSIVGSPASAQVLVLGNYEPHIRGRVVYRPAFDEVAKH